MKTQATTNAHQFDYWLEGMGHSAFCAAFSLAAIRNRLVTDRASLQKQLDVQRERTRSLFAETYPPASVKEELAMRYAFHETILNVE